MKRIPLLCTLAWLLSSDHLAAQLPETQPTEEERYLFIVNTASSMRRLDDATRQALFDLIHWGIGGHMVQGDTYGLWTFNSETYAGKFSMQIWDPAKRLELASRACHYLKDQPHKSKAEFGQVMKKVTAVLNAVQDVNFVILTDAEAPVNGSPFDEQINAACQARYKEMRQAKQPFVITLVGRGGTFSDWGLTLGDEPVLLPARRPIPPPPATAQVAPPKVEAHKEKAKDPPKPLGNVISIRASSTPPASTVNIPSPNVPSPSAVAPLSAGAGLQPSQSPSSVPAAPQSSVAPPTKPLGQVLSLKATATTEPLPSNIIPAPAKPPAVSGPQPVPAPTSPSAPAGPPLLAKNASSPLPISTTIGPVDAPPSSFLWPNDRPKLGEPLAGPSQSLLPDSAPAESGVSGAAQLSNPPRTVAAREPTSAEITTAEMTASATPIVIRPVFSPRELFVAGALLLLTACGLVLLLIRRNRPVSPGSLITRSIGHPRL